MAACLPLLTLCFPLTAHQPKKYFQYKLIPPSIKKQERDPFDYPLRSLAEVKREHKYFPPNFEWTVESVQYPSSDQRQHESLRVDHRDKICRIFIDLNDLNLSPEQRERFIFLLGPRFTGSTKIKFVSREFFTYQENYIKCLELMREIYFEALRAPSRNITMLRNPYRREFLIKKLFGKTAEERRASRAEFKKGIKAHYREVDEEIARKEAYENEVAGPKRSRRRRSIAQRRAKLGFNDGGAIEMDDPQIDKIEFTKNMQNIEDEVAMDRSTQINTRIQQFEKASTHNTPLLDQDKFRDA